MSNKKSTKKSKRVNRKKAWNMEIEMIPDKPLDEVKTTVIGGVIVEEGCEDMFVSMKIRSTAETVKENIRKGRNVKWLEAYEANTEWIYIPLDKLAEIYESITRKLSEEELPEDFENQNHKKLIQYNVGFFDGYTKAQEKYGIEA